MIALVRLTGPVLARRRATVALIAGSILVAGVFQFVPPLVMGRFLGVLISASRAGATAATRTELSWLFVAIAGGVVTILGFQFLANRSGMWLSTVIAVELRTRVHAAVLGMSFRERLALDAGTLQTRILADSGAVEGFFSVALPTIAIQTIFVAGALALLVARAPFLAPLVALPLAILVVAALGLRRACDPALRARSAPARAVRDGCRRCGDRAAPPLDLRRRLPARADPQRLAVFVSALVRRRHGRARRARNARRERSHRARADRVAALSTRLHACRDPR